MGEWENKYYELVGHKEVLIQKLNDGLFAPPEWEQLIDELKAHNMHAMANDLKKRYDEYKAKWVNQPVEVEVENVEVSA
jgi:hypothetical protein